MQVSTQPRPTEGLGVDLGRIIEHLRTPPPPLEPGALVLPATGDANARLRQWVGCVYLKRFFVTVARVFPLASAVPLRQTTRALVGAVAELPPEPLGQALLRPELTSLVWRLIQAHAEGRHTRIDGLLGHLASFLLPVAILGGELPESCELWLRPAGSHHIDLGPLGCSILSPHPLPELLRVWRQGPALYLEDGTGRARALPLDGLRRAPAEHDGLRIQPHSTLDGTSIAILRPDRWYAEAYPRHGEHRSSPLDLHLDHAGLMALQADLGAGARLVREHWPAAFSSLTQDVQTIVPLESRGLDPHNETLPAFRGLVASSARPGYLAAQTLLHEAGHNRLNSLLEVVDLVRNDPAATYPSPFVGEPRPMLALLHGVFSFLQEIELDRRILGRVSEIEGLSLEQYHEVITRRVDRALATILEHAQLTPAGEAVVASFCTARRAS